MILRKDNFDDKSLITPARTELVQNRLKPIKTMVSAKMPMDNRPNSWGLFASMLNGVANIGRTITGVIAQNDQAIEDREFAKILPDLEADMAGLTGKDISVLPEMYDEILNKYSEQFGSLDYGKRIIERLKTRLITDTRQKAGALFSGSVAENQKLVITAHQEKLADAIQRGDRKTATSLIWQARKGPNAFLNGDAAVEEQLRATRQIDLHVAKNQLYNMDYNEAMAKLDDPNALYDVGYDANPDKQINLSTNETAALKTIVTNNYTLEEKARIAAVNVSSNNAYKALFENEITFDELLTSNDPKFQGLSYKEKLAIGENYESETRSDVAHERSEEQFSAYEDVQAKINSGEFTTYAQVEAYDAKSDNKLREQDKRQMGIDLALGTEDPKKIADIRSGKMLSELLKDFELNQGRGAILISQALAQFGSKSADGEYPNINYTDYRFFVDMVEGRTGVITPAKAYGYIEDHVSLEDKPGLQNDVKDIYNKLIRDQYNQNDPDKMLSDRESREALDQIIADVSDKGVQKAFKEDDGSLVATNWYNLGMNDLDKDINYANEGRYNYLYYSDPGKIESYKDRLNASYEQEFGEIPNVVRYQNGIVPVYDKDGVEMVWEIRFGKPKLISFEDAVKENEPLRSGLAIGERNGAFTILQTGQYLINRDTVKEVKKIIADDGVEVVVFHPVDNEKNLLLGEGNYLLYENSYGNATISKYDGNLNKVEIAAAYKYISSPKTEEDTARESATILINGNSYTPSEAADVRETELKDQYKGLW